MLVHGGLWKLQWRDVSLAYWLLLLTGSFVWLAGWAIGAWSWMPTVREAVLVVASALLVETIALANHEADDTLSEVARWLGRRRLFIPWSLGAVLSATATLWIADLLGAKPAVEVLQAGVVLTALPYLGSHFYQPPTARTRALATLPNALWGGLAHGGLYACAGIAPYGAVLLVAVIFSALGQGAVFFMLED